MRPLTDKPVVGLGFGLAVAEHRAWGYPWTTAIVVAGTLMPFGGVIMADPHSAVFAGALLALAAPVYWCIARRRALG